MDNNSNNNNRKRVSPPHVRLKERQEERAVSRGRDGYEPMPAPKPPKPPKKMPPQKASQKKRRKAPPPNILKFEQPRKKQKTRPNLSINYSAVAAVLALIVAVAVGYMMFLRPNSYRIFIDNEHIATIAHNQMDEETFVRTIEAMLSTNHNTNVVLLDEISLRATNTRSNTHIHPNQALQIALAGISYNVEGGLMIVNGSPLFTVASVATAEQIVYDIAHNLAPAGTTVQNVTATNLEIRPNIIFHEEIVNPDVAIATLTDTTREQLPHIVQQGESFWSIAVGLGLSLEDIFALNPAHSENQGVRVGEVIVVARDIPLLTVVTEEELEVLNYIEPLVEHVVNSSLEQGQTNTLQEGEVGQVRTVFSITRTDGAETSRTLISEEILATPVPYIIEIGN